MENKYRTANILGAMCLAISDKLVAELKEHSRQNDTSAASLNVIGFGEGLSNGQLGAALGITHSATVRLLDKLVEAELVEVRPGVDRRAVAIFLTTAGRERVTELLRSRSHTLANIVDLLSCEQRRHLDSIAETVLAHFTQAPVDALHICRLCEVVKCPAERCPVHLKKLPKKVGKPETGYHPAPPGQTS